MAKKQPISPTELRIAALVTEGWRNKEIAVSLGKSHASITQHLELIMHKIGAHNRAMVAAWYVRRTEVRE